MQHSPYDHIRMSGLSREQIAEVARSYARHPHLKRTERESTDDLAKRVGAASGGAVRKAVTRIREDLSLAPCTCAWPDSFLGEDLPAPAQQVFELAIPAATARMQGSLPHDAPAPCQPAAPELGASSLPISGVRGQDSYEYDPQAKRYNFELVGLGTRTFSAEAVQDWFARYSRYSDPKDKGAQVREICRAHNMTPSTFDRIRRVLDLTHQAAPFAPHRLQEEDPVALVRETLQMREQKYVQTLIQSEDQFTRQRYDALMKERVGRNLWAQALSKEMIREPLPLQILPPPPSLLSDEELGLAIVLADAHAGKQVQKGTVVGHGADGMDKRRFVERWDAMIRRIQGRIAGRNVRELGLFDLGDMLESILANMHWGHAGNVFEVGARQMLFAKALLIRLVVGILAVAPERSVLKLLRVPGNHDRLGEDRHDDPYRTPWMILSYWLRDELKAFEDAGRIQWVFPNMPAVDSILDPDDEERGENRRPWAGMTVLGHPFIGRHGDINALTPEKLINLFQHDTGLAYPTYTLLRGHLHGLEMKQKGQWADWLCPAFIPGDDHSNARLGFLSFSGATVFEVREGDVFPTGNCIWLGQQPQITVAA